MLESLDRLIDDVGNLNNKLILLIGPQNSGKTALLNEISAKRRLPVVSVGARLGQSLLPTPIAQRRLKAAEMLSEALRPYRDGGLILLDNIEILFDRTLALDPLDLLKRQSRWVRVVATWPGELARGRLSYAPAGHPEHQDYAFDGAVPFKMP